MNTKRLTISLLLLLFAVACSEGSPPSTTGAQPHESIAQDPNQTPSSPSQWQLSEVLSSIDGQLVVARRVFRSDPGDSLVASVQCATTGKNVRVFIDSFTGADGELEFPNPIAYRAQPGLMGTGKDSPIGRVRSGNFGVLDLGDILSVESGAANRISLDKLSPQQEFDEVDQRIRPYLGPNDVNQARVVADMLPLAIELKNVSGTRELVIDPSNQVLEVLSRCGAADGVFPLERLERARSQAASAEAASLREHTELATANELTIANEKSDRGRECRARGTHPMLREFCQTDFPDEFAALQADIDSVISEAKSKHCKLDRAAVETNVGNLGIDSERSRILEMPRCSMF